MSLKTINLISEKLGELRELFLYGQRVLPAVEELFSFVREITPLLEELNVLVRDSTLKIPRASSQLHSVTEATEVATCEILDHTDFVLTRLEASRAASTACAAALDELSAQDEELFALAAAGAEPARLDDLRARRLALREQARERLESQLRSADEAYGKAGRIMIALQVQDITAQKLAAVNHLIGSIQHRLGALLEHAQDPPARPESFNEHAAYDRSGDRQRMADDLFANPPASQADIDALFRR